ncbi:unnamed protein product [Spirodela intermedia]|uniref:Uncharacterized protein n=1 Tax=Spirodela intermedia TaxID=51605 RepID=A0A7I8KXL7_SPIIN|nr:unnamed protein product [Spirodela intermedia]
MGPLSPLEGSAAIVLSPSWSLLCSPPF